MERPTATTDKSNLQQRIMIIVVLASSACEIAFSQVTKGHSTLEFYGLAKLEFTFLIITIFRFQLGLCSVNASLE
jgi:hypothetical protein